MEAPNSLPSGRQASAKSRINSNHPISKQNLFCHLKFGFGTYLGFVIWNFVW
jgi:hypothetical protein